MGGMAPGFLPYLVTQGVFTHTLGVEGDSFN